MTSQHVPGRAKYGRLLGIDALPSCALQPDLEIPQVSLDAVQLNLLTFLLVSTEMQYCLIGRNGVRFSRVRSMAKQAIGRWPRRLTCVLIAGCGLLSRRCHEDRAIESQCSTCMCIKNRRYKAIRSTHKSEPHRRGSDVVPVCRPDWHRMIATTSCIR